MALKLDPFAQRKLLDLAAADRIIDASEHRRRSLPELAVIASGAARSAAARRDLVMAQTEVQDLDRATKKLDAEVDQVRARAQRDADRLQSGESSPKELEGLQHEIESLKRRQATLEDEELELMEQREQAESALTATAAVLAEISAELAAAEEARDAAFADIDAVLTEQRQIRSVLVAGLPADVLAVYSRVRDSGKIAAGALTGSRCGACRLEIDRTALAEIKSAPVDQVVRCTECGAILVRA